jgi:protein SCO1
MLARGATKLGGMIVAALLATTLGACSSGSRTASSTATAPATVAGASGFDGAALPGAGAAIPDFTLREENGARVSLSGYRGRVTIVAFPYTTCGAPCTVIAEQIRGALDELGEPVPVLLISADPSADTPARVRALLARTSLDARARYLTGTRAQLEPLWRAFHVVLPSAGAHAFANYASVFLLDGSGRERVIFQLEQLTPEALAHDVRKLLSEHR